MAGAGSTLAEHGEALDAATRSTLARSIETKAREMSDLISNVLDLMRFESGQIHLRNDWQTLDELVESSLRRLEEPLARLQRRAAHCRRICRRCMWMRVSIIQVFTNLLDNIVKYTPPGTHIQIAAAMDGGGAGSAVSADVRVTVDDDGPGLPAGDPARLFDKFQRGTGEGTIVGVGLGPRHLPGHHSRARRGDRGARPRPGGGTRIELTLPTAEPSMTQAMHQILVIEDDASIREVLQALLGSVGFRVIEAATAARADIEARAHKPDLLLVDLGLPDGDGLTVIRSVRGWSPVPIIVLSARTMEEQKIAALDAGADDYIAKPFSAAELLARVRAALQAQCACQ